MEQAENQPELNEQQPTGQEAKGQQPSGQRASKNDAVVYEGELAKAFVNKRPRILSGMRPTGKLHIGHWAGALESWTSLQTVAENFFLIADYHALTTNLDSSRLTELSLEMAMDWIAFGIDPERSPIFRQSHVKEHTELFLLFSMLITKTRLERNPAVKDQVRDLGIGDSLTFGHLGYPVLQAADILLYKGDLVPVGEDQVPHVEMSREFARKFNEHYRGTNADVFIEPKAYVTNYSRLPGLDGKRMSKSIGNTILLSDSAEETGKKMRTALTDPKKARKNDPGTPEICLVFTYHNKWNPSEVEEIRQGCSTGALGCVDCKKRATEKLNEAFAPMRAMRVDLEAKPAYVLEVLQDGESRARTVAAQTMQEVHSAMQFG